MYEKMRREYIKLLRRKYPTVEQREHKQRIANALSYIGFCFDCLGFTGEDTKHVMWQCHCDASIIERQLKGEKWQR